MIYNFDTFPNRRATESAKWNYYPDDVLPMWVADMDFVSPEPVIQALKARVEHGVFGYPLEMTDLRQAIVERMADRYRWTIQPDDIIFVPGVVVGFNLACHAFARPGEGLVIQPPVYPPILCAADTAGLVRQDAGLVQADGGEYQIDWDAFTAAFTPQARLFLLCNPHNPVGRVFRQDELEQMAHFCLQRKVVICSDEIHSDLVYDGHRHIPVAALDPEIAQNTITLISPSKTFNIAGLECSVAIIQNPEMRKTYLGARCGLVGWVNVFGQVAALAAYREGQEWLEQLMVYLAGNREFLYRYVQSEMPGVCMQPPEGTYLAWLDFRETGIAGSPYQFFLDKARVALNDGLTFGAAGSGFARLNFGCPRAMLQEALDRMRAALLDRVS